MARRHVGELDAVVASLQAGELVEAVRSRGAAVGRGGGVHRRTRACGVVVESHGHAVDAGVGLVLDAVAVRVDPDGVAQGVGGAHAEAEIEGEVVLFIRVAVDLTGIILVAVFPFR